VVVIRNYLSRRGGARPSSSGAPDVDGGLGNDSSDGKLRPKSRFPPWAEALDDMGQLLCVPSYGDPLLFLDSAARSEQPNWSAAHRMKLDDNVHATIKSCCGNPNSLPRLAARAENTKQTCHPMVAVLGRLFNVGDLKLSGWALLACLGVNIISTQRHEAIAAGPQSVNGWAAASSSNLTDSSLEHRLDVGLASSIVDGQNTLHGKFALRNFFTVFRIHQSGGKPTLQ
jgi:hypothetical protein